MGSHFLCKYLSGAVAAVDEVGLCGVGSTSGFLHQHIAGSQSLQSVVVVAMTLQMRFALWGSKCDRCESGSDHHGPGGVLHLYAPAGTHGRWVTSHSEPLEFARSEQVKLPYQHPDPSQYSSNSLWGSLFGASSMTPPGKSPCIESKGF